MNVGILSKEDIINEMEQGRLITRADESSVEPCSYDMKIGTIFSNGQVVNGSHPKANEQVIIQPGEIISVFTFEELDLPVNIAATAFAMNSQSSRGLLVLNPGHIDPGFKGSLTVKVLNLRKVPLALGLGTPIFTIVFECLPKSTDAYDRNMSRNEREREFNARDVETAPRDLAELVVLSKKYPFPTRQEVKDIVKGHWSSWVALSFMFIAAIGAIVAAVAAIANITIDSQRSESQAQHSVEKGILDDTMTSSTSFKGTNTQK